MKIERRQRSLQTEGNGGKVGPSGGITAENYIARCRAFIAGGGGDGFVIRAIEGIDGSSNSEKAATEPQWSAWVKYWECKGISNKFSLKRGMATVPAEWPEDFDYEADVSDRFASLPRTMKMRDYSPSPIITQGFTVLRRRLGSTDKAPNKPPPPAAEELGAVYASTPVTFGPHLMAAIESRKAEAV